MSAYMRYIHISRENYIPYVTNGKTLFIHFNIPETGMQLKVSSTACKFYCFVYIHDMCMKYSHACVSMHVWRSSHDNFQGSVLSLHPGTRGGNAGRLADVLSAFIHRDFLSAWMHICCCIFLVADNIKLHVSSDSTFNEMKQSLTVHSFDAGGRAGK